MDIWVYSDESGVFDPEHEPYYVFGGMIFVSRVEKELCTLRFSAVENEIKSRRKNQEDREIKAAEISKDWKLKLYRSTEDFERFGAVLSLRDIDGRIFENKKTKQRYLDWIFRRCVINKLRQMIWLGLFDRDEVTQVHFLVDEHTTSTDGLYELQETLESELKTGMWNFETMKFTEPIFAGLSSVDVRFCNSKKETLIRSSDIIANRLLGEARENNGMTEPEDTLYIYRNL